jgi:hypothetical protein
MYFRPRGAILALAASLMLGGCLDGKGDDDVWYGYYYDDLRQNAEGALSRPYQSAQECRAAMQDYTMEAKVTSGFACARACDAAHDGVIANCREVVR